MDLLEPISMRSTVLNVDPSNTNNPMDSVGLIHNEFVDAVAFDEDFETLDIVLFLNEYAKVERGWYDFSQLQMDSMVGVILSYCLEDDFDGLIDTLASSAGYSVSLIAELKELMSVLNVNREDVEIADLIDSIVVKETQFSLGVFSAVERNIYYGTASVLRYSSSYWDAVLEDDTHPYHSILVDYLIEYDDEEEFQRAFKWWKVWRALAVVGADALGFAAGYGLGSALSAGLPAVGATCGTLLGGAASAGMKDIWE